MASRMRASVSESVASSAEHADVVLVPNARLISEGCRHGFAC